MDTQTEADKNNRELTKTEVELAAAEIKDRLHRLLECQDMLSKADYDGDEGYQSTQLKLRQKYQIPSEVRLFEEDCYSICAKQVDRWIKPFVAGQLSEDLIELEIIGHAMEMDEYDYPWVFLGVHGNFYDTETGIDIEEADKEIIAIGSRSKNKSQSCTRYQHWYDDVLINAMHDGYGKIVFLQPTEGFFGQKDSNFIWIDTLCKKYNSLRVVTFPLTNRTMRWVLLFK